jgi:hypothetical protein
MKLFLFCLILVNSTLTAQPLERSIRVSLYQPNGESVDLLKSNGQPSDVYRVRCFTWESYMDDQSPLGPKINSYHNHPVLLKVPCSKKDSSSYELLCYSFSVSFYDIESIKLLINHGQDSMILTINNIPIPVPVLDVVIDHLVFNPGNYAIDFKDIEKNKFERIWAADTLRQRNVCNSCFILNGSVNSMFMGRSPDLDETKLLVIVNSRTIKKINQFEKFLNGHNMLLSENSPSNAQKINLNKYLIVKKKDGGLFASDNCPQLEIIRKNTRHVKFAGQLMYYGNKNGIGVAYTNHITVRLKKSDLASFKLLIASKKLVLVSMHEQPGETLMMQLRAEDTVGAGILNIADDLKQSGLIYSVDILSVQAMPVSDLGPQ